MTAKRLTLALLFALAPLAAHAQNLLTFAGDPGGTYCVLFTDAENTAVDFSESAQAGHFAIADSALVTAGLDASATPYAARVYARAASGLNPTTHASLWVATISGIRWNGTSTLTDEQALLATSTTGSPASNTVHQALQWLRATYESSGVWLEAAFANMPATNVELSPEDIQDIADAVIAGGGGISPVSPDVIVATRTWVAQGFRARNIVEVEDGFIGTFALAPDLNDATTINTVSAVSITGAATVVATDLSVDRSRTKAHFTVPALTTTGTYTVRVTVVTVDGQTIITTGMLKVQ